MNTKISVAAAAFAIDQICSILADDSVGQRASSYCNNSQPTQWTGDRLL